ncbi:MAG TPA: PLD nuclease N-terminal domain-containing protein [Streptosporangiaceae bacterium]|nr:PLD nuclease N-terminal domain-containing protein [Streptosporangiaceae bacterium]
MIDIAMTPSYHFDLPSKRLWLTVLVAFWVFGAVAWLLIGRRDVRMRAVCDDLTGSWSSGTHQSLWSAPNRGTRPGIWPGTGRRGHDAMRQHPSAMESARFIAPDDNPDFLLELARRIRGDRDRGSDTGSGSDTDNGA